MRRLYLITLAALCSGLAFGQNTGGGGAKTSTIKSGTSLPPTCTPAANNIFLLTSPLPAVLYWCSNTNTWTTPSGGSVTTGNLTESTSSVLTITGGTGAVVGNGTTIQVKQANTSTNGYLSSTDWNTFNGKASIPSAGIVKSTGTALAPALVADFPILNQNTTGSAASFTGSLLGDVTGTQGATIVGKLLGNTIPANASGCLSNNGTGTLSWAACSGGGGSGTVTSVGLTAPSWLTVSGSPVTTSGTLALTTTGSQTANQFLATPNGTTGAVGLRSIVAADIPTLNQSTTGNAATATALAANPVDCSAGQYANAIAANGNLTCTAVSYSQVSGTPTLFNQTIQNSGTPVTQRAKLNFVGGTNVTITPTDNGTDTTTLTFAASGGGGSPGGTNTAVQFNNSGAFGGDATNFSYNSTTHALTVTGGITSSSTSSGTITLNGSTSGSAAIQVAATAGTPAPLQLPTTTGAAGNILTTNGANPQVLSWTTIPRSINATFDGGGSALTTGKVYYTVVPFACTIAAWNLTVDTGTATVKLWKVANGTAIPTSANSINTSGISISTGTNIHSTTLTDFTTTSIAANDIVAITDTAVSGATLLQVGIQCNE